MASGIKTWYTISTILVILNMVLVVVSKQQVPCYFIFGDSLVDNGNNNAKTKAPKANYSPYGIDFPDGPTGRFSNGRNIADLLAELLGFDNYIPPFATAKSSEIILGVNYGSGGAGIRDDTGRQQGDVNSLNKQLLNHQITISRLTRLLGSKNATMEYLNKCFYHVGMGSNDYINNYLEPNYYISSHIYSPDQYAQLLIQQYSEQLRTLYFLGARKVAVFDIGLIGLTPAEKQRNGDGYSTYVNAIVGHFNGRFKLLIDDLNTNLPNARFICISLESIILGLSDFKVIDAPCCTTSPSNGQCISGEAPCNNRTAYYFYDEFHPTERGNWRTASRAYKRQSLTDAYPVDISHLVQLE